jgi:hypothetical protein
MRRALLLATLIALVLPTAQAQASVLLGVVGSASRLHNQTAQRSDVRMRFTGWGGGQHWGGGWDSFLIDTAVPVIAFGTHNKYGHEAITPRRIAQGYGDSYLIAMNKAISDYGRPVYIRPMAEMNGHWNAYCAFNSNGTSRGDSHSTKNFKLAFRRIYTIVHGGDVGAINTRFARWNIRKVQTARTSLPANTAPTLQVIWNPQGFGSPDIPANSAQAYYPGEGYVDMVADDIYDIGGRYTYDAMVDLYKAHPGKPFALGEFGLWDVDDPSFIRKMAYFFKTYKRTKLAIFYESVQGSIFDLASKPQSRVAYKQYIAPLAP